MTGAHASPRGDTADVVVVGGGVIGVACAFCLSRAGRRVVLIERGGLGSGTSRTGQGGVGIDVDHDDWDLNWHRAAMKSYRDLAAEGFDPDYRQRGGLFLAHDEADATRLRHGAERLGKLGLTVDWLDAPELRRLEPNLAHDLVGAVRVGEIVEVSPLKVVAGLARDANCDIRLHTPLTGIVVTGGRVEAVETSDGPIFAPAIVIACGIWSREVAAMVGLDVPVWPLKGHLLATEPCPDALGHFVSSSRYGATSSASLKTEIDGDGPRPGVVGVATVLQNLATGPILVGSSREFAGLDRAPSNDRVADIAERAIAVLPLLATASVVRVFTGFRPWSPDARPLLGPTAAIDGLYFATGHAGEGTTGALVTGHLLAGMIDGHAPPFSLAPVAPDRFPLC